MAIKIQEKDLYYPLKSYLEKLDYTVDGEVKDCDILVKAQDRHFAIELKTDLNFKVILQAVQRQKMFDLVYIAIPIQKVNLRSKSYKEKLHLLHRLGIGLFLVNLLTKEVECVQLPLEAERSRIMAANKKKKERAVAEFEKRILKNNVGGVHQKKITTFYRQQCYQVAYLLKDKPRSAADLSHAGLEHKRVAAILQGNFYGWFEKIERGIYGLSDIGRQALEENKEVVEILMKELSQNNDGRQNN